MKRTVVSLSLGVLWTAACQAGIDDSDLDGQNNGSATAVFSSEEGSTFRFAARNPRLRSLFASSSPEDAAISYLDQYRHAAKLPEGAVDSARIAGVHEPKSGSKVVKLTQEVGGFTVHGKQMSVVLDKDMRLVALSGQFAPTGTGDVARSAFALGDRAAIARSVEELVSFPVAASAIVPVDGVAETASPRWTAYESAAVASFQLSQAAARSVLYPAARSLVPAYSVEVELLDPETRSSRAYAFVVAADDGRILERRDLTFFDAFTYRVWAEDDELRTPSDGPHGGGLTPHPTGNVEDEIAIPGAVDRKMVRIEGFNKNPDGDADPWLPANATTTRGNNVLAYADHTTPDGFSDGDVFGKTSTSKTFSWPYSDVQSPVAPSQVQSAVVQIFYVTNWLHDWYYDSGFTEEAGNAQKDNFGRGGEDNDPLLAEAQDTRGTTGRNNANMSTPSDGISPRMQMYLWDGSVTPIGETELEITSPASIAGSYEAAGATFGIDDLLTATASVALADDATATPTDGCEAVTNNLAGKIAIMDRGTCPFVLKANNAVAAGAAGLIIVNNDAANPDALPPLGGSDPAIDIPVVGISLNNGNVIKGALGSTVNADMSRAGRLRGPDRDGTIDNAIVAHEWGHYIHHRLTKCGTSQCSAMSEGWGDFVALHMEVRKGDDYRGVYAKAAWSTGDSYFGIRRVPYSVDFDRNALTFGHVANSAQLPTRAPIAPRGPNSEVHNAGEVWATALFEVYIALIEKHGYDTARRRMSDYIVEGMLLAPVNTTFTEQRDAILAAVAARDPEDLEVVAGGFGRRGLGTGAESPPRDSSDFEGTQESFAVAGDLKIHAMAVELDNDCDQDGNLDSAETGALKISVINTGVLPLVDTRVQITGLPAGVNLPPRGDRFDIPMLGAFEMAEVRLPIELDPELEGVQGLVFEIEVRNAEAHSREVSGALVERANYDDTKKVATTDDIESNEVPWEIVDLAEEIGWRRVQDTELNTVWQAVDPATLGEQTLTSPVLEIGAEPFVLSFDHRYKFESADGEEEGSRIHYDGAVVEVSMDRGKTWVDASTLAKPKYTGTITGESSNPLGGHAGYVDQSANWPEMERETLDFGTALAGQRVQLRFRLGSDPAVGEAGWEIDNVEALGIVNTPFSTIGDDQTDCIPVGLGPKEDGGCQTAGGRGQLAWLALVALVAPLAWRRRRSAKRSGAPGRG